MKSSTKPTILFIHGSWHNPNHFRPIRDLFESEGFPTKCPRQPTFNAKPAPPIISLADDVKVIKSTLTKLVEEHGMEVIVVMHSYGGVLGSESVHESFGKKAREGKGLAGGVTELLYICAFILPVGAALDTALGGSLPRFIKIQISLMPSKKYIENGLCTMDEPERRFFSGLSKEEQDHCTPVTYAAYQHYPATYLFCTNDQALNPEIQQMMVNGAGGAFKTESCPAGHSPFLSHPKTVLEIVKKWAA